MICDIVTFNGEQEIWEIRYHVLKDVIDEFRVIEFDETFSGKPKEPKFTQNWDKVKHYLVTKETWGKYEELAKASPNTQYGEGALHWIQEFAQKEAIRDCLVDLKDEDTLFIGDCDEVWHPSLVVHEPKRTHKLGLLVYSYYLNNKSSESFYGTIFTTYGIIKDKCLNHIRSVPSNYSYIPNAGWHFTSIGGHEKVKEKLTDSYTKDSYANDQVLGNLKENIENSKDFLGRNFTYTIDESQWPSYLTNNKDKYKHLLRHE